MTKKYNFLVLFDHLWDKNLTQRTLSFFPSLNVYKFSDIISKVQAISMDRILLIYYFSAF